MSPLPWNDKKEEIKEVKKDIVQPVKEEIAEKKISVQPEEKLQSIVIHSETDAFIIDRLKSQPKNRGEVDLQVLPQTAPNRHQLSIPEFEKYDDKYAFCWIYKKKKAIDEAMDIYHWIIVNQTHFPELPDYLFTARGVVERGDEILMFRSKKIDSEMRKVPGIESTSRIKAREEAHLNNPNFYIPKPEDQEEKRVIGV